MRNGGDDPNLADPIVKFITSCGLTVLVGGLDQRFVLRHASQDFFKPDDDLRRPDAVFLEGHELDKTHDHTFCARELAEGNNLIFIEAAQQYTIDLYRIEASASRGTNTSEHTIKPVGYTC